MRQRARNPEDKQERRRAILAAGRELWETTPWSEFTMAAVAERAGVVKGTLYLYFATKEELFLALLMEMLAGYFDEVDAALLSPRGPWTNRRVVELVAVGLRERAAFTRMLTMLGSILEHNVCFDSALALQRLMRDRFARSGALLEARLPFVRRGEGAPLVRHLSALATGLAHMAFPAPVMQRVYAVEGMEGTRVDLVEAFQQVFATLLDGLEARPRARGARR